MTVEKLSHWLQITASVGVFVGLVLVYHEMRQTRDIAVLGQTVNAFNSLVERNVAEIGETPYEAVVKACMSPEDLTEEDAYILDTKFWNHLTVVFRYRRAHGIFELDLNNTWQDVAAPEFYQIFETLPGRRWFEAVAPNLPKDVVDAGNKVMSSMPEECVGWLSQMSEGA